MTETTNAPVDSSFLGTGWAFPVSLDASGSVAVASVEEDVVRKEIEARIPLGEIPPQDEIAHSVVFLASPWSKVVTGQTLDVNGGEWFG